MIDLILVPATMVMCLAALGNKNSVTCQYILTQLDCGTDECLRNARKKSVMLTVVLAEKRADVWRWIVIVRVIFVYLLVLAICGIITLLCMVYKEYKDEIQEQRRNQVMVQVVPRQNRQSPDRLSSAQSTSRQMIQLEREKMQRSITEKACMFAEASLKAQETNICAVCIEVFDLVDDVIEMSCGHIFHKDCLMGWF